MSFKSQSRFLFFFAVMMTALVVTSGHANAQTPEIYLAMNDTSVTAGDTTGWLTVSFANYQDTLAAFTMRIVLDNPDLINFRTDAVDTTFDTIWQYCGGWDNFGACTLWVDTMFVDTIVRSGAIDTVGTLLSGWEFVTAQSYSANRTDIKVTALADAFGGDKTPGLPPRTNPGVLFRIRFRANNETLDSTDNTVLLDILSNLTETGFSDPQGDLFGVISGFNICDTVSTDPELVCDTFFRYWRCEVWNGPVCSTYVTSTDPDSAAFFTDSLSIDTVNWTLLNDQTVFYTDGHVTVDFSDCLCGDANDDGTFNIGDPVYLISYIFKGGPPPPYMDCANVNGDTTVNIGDVVYMIQAIFNGGPLPSC
ncbi:MAG: dockerin type I repeat-containing protein [Candidatus Zixiibacteriota bacterium]